MLNATEIMELQKLAGMENFKKLTIPQCLAREKLIRLICSTEYGNGSLMGKNFQKGFIEKIADHLIANGVTVQEWISVKDKYPNHGDVVLICTKDKDVQVFQWDAVYNGWVGDRYNYSVKYVTHWMPLLDAPKEESV